MRIISWNINGIKAHFDGLKELTARYQPDIVCLQKVKSKNGIENFPLEGYEIFDLPFYRSQYYGVASYFRNIEHPLMNFPNKLAIEGHFQAINLGQNKPVLFNVYAPYSNATDYKFTEARKAFDPALSWFAASLGDTPIIMCGDFNVVFSDIDCWDNKFPRGSPCFYDWEVFNFEELMKHNNLVDAFRHFHPQERKYTYFDSRDKNRAQGYRIDYFLISECLLPKVLRCHIIEDIAVSNSNPLLLDIDLKA